ncbi:hypothetical protein Scep_001082 [Stephania cephalantha]|uniref:U2A'/phosphoprotein 32 family A C-terminal domain-containing protein n=1 Tax=Stephania cephalantha TaxID=152367 RepID=A0AAP0L7H9_9MAGN
MAMPVHLPTLESRYIDFCRKREVLPNDAIVSSFSKAKLQKSCFERSILQVLLDLLMDVDVPPLIETFSLMGSYEIDAIDIINESPCVLKRENVMSLMRAANQKLRVVDINDSSFGKDFLRDLSYNGLMCQVLNLRSSHIRKLNLVGNFMQLHTLNLDFSISLTSFREDCFSCMPNLMRLSMCETRVSNLWTTSVALSKLPSLVELRFQNCLCCIDTRPCPALSNEKENFPIYEKSWVNHLEPGYSETPSGSTSDPRLQNAHHCRIKEPFENLVLACDSVLCDEPLEYTSEESSSDDSEMDFSDCQRRTHPEKLATTVPTDTIIATRQDSEQFTSKNPSIKEASAYTSNFEHSRDAADFAPKKYVSHHPSPICFEKHYREYMITSLPRLEVLDNIPIKRTEREMAKTIFSQCYEHLPYNQQRKESLVNVLQWREVGIGTGPLGKLSNPKQLYPVRRSKCFFSRSISAAKLGSSAWPLIHSVSKIGGVSGETKSFRPRQFEYHPSNSSLMVFGTLDGEIVVINHESGEIVSYVSSIGTLNSVLGLCWLRRHPSKLIAGSDNGSLQLYDMHQMPSTVAETYTSANFVSFDGFEQLTSLHVNSTDEYFIASGYSKNVALYDIGSGKRLQVISDMHNGHINVVKFAHHSPSLFATSSFDRDVKLWDLRQCPSRPCYTSSSSKGNVMVCFSPDDQYLLSSAVDNEVKQLLAVDGRVHMKFEIASTGSAQNYTRSYYLNGRDYVISGSCEEHVVRICCARTGRRLRDVSLETRGSRNSIFVQSLRGDPFRDFNMSVLAAYMRPSSKFEILKINLMESNKGHKEHSHRV